MVKNFSTRFDALYMHTTVDPTLTGHPVYTGYPRIRVFPLNDRFVRSFGNNFSSAKMSRYQ